MLIVSSNKVVLLNTSYKTKCILREIKETVKAAVKIRVIPNSCRFQLRQMSRFQFAYIFTTTPYPLLDAPPTDTSTSFTNKISVGSVTPTEFQLNKIFIKKFRIQRQSSKFQSASTSQRVFMPVSI